jgi:hypothetical protein
MGKAKAYNETKIIVSGDLLEAFFYRKNPEFGFEISAEHNASFTLWRARTRLKRIINTNAGRWYDDKMQRFYLPQFFTLTFASNVTDVSDANYEFMKFIQRFNKKLLGTKKMLLKYSAVIEFQKRGAVHYHVILYNFPFTENYVKKLYELWTWGRINISSIYSIGDIGNYVTKYMVKGFDDIRLKGKKRYWNSRGLRKPLVFKDDEADTFDLLFSLNSKNVIYENDGERLLYRYFFIKNIPDFPYEYIRRKENELLTLPVAGVVLNSYKGRQERLI